MARGRRVKAGPGTPASRQKPANPARKPITLTDLLAEIGNDRLELQMLGESLHGDQKLVNKGRDLQVSFLTDPKNMDLADLVFGRKPRRNAFVVWADSADIEAAWTRLGVAASRERLRAE